MISTRITLTKLPFMRQKIVLVNDFKTRIPGTRTFWHFLEDTLGAKFISNKKWFWKKRLDKFEPNVIIQNAFWGDLNIKNRPIIMLIQDNYHALMKNNFLDEDICNKQIQKIKSAINVADFVVVNVNSLLRLYEIPEKKGCWIPMGVDSSIFYPASNERNNTRKELGITGQCNIFVGDETLIHGWDQVELKIKENDDIIWILVSKNNPFSIEGKNIRKFCNIDHDMLRKLYNASDLFFARGSIGLPAVEAMLCGTKVDVTHDIGYFEDWNQENKDPRAEIIDAGFDLKDTIQKWKEIVIKVSQDYEHSINGI